MGAAPNRWAANQLSLLSLADQAPSPAHDRHRRRFEPMPPSALPAKSDARFDVGPREAPSAELLGHSLHVRDRLLRRACAGGAPRTMDHMRRRRVPPMPFGTLPRQFRPRVHVRARDTATAAARCDLTHPSDRAALARVAVRTPVPAAHVRRRALEHVTPRAP